MTKLTKEQAFKPMREADVLEAIENDDRTALGLLFDAIPGAGTRFNRLTANLHTLLLDIREHFPDAKFYSANGTVHLMLGDSHDMRGKAQNELVAVTATNLDIGGGDW